MGPVEVEITPLSQAEVAVSVRYQADRAPVIKRWRADRAVIDKVCESLAEILEDTRHEPPTDERAREHRADIEKRLKALGLTLFQEIFKEEGDRVRSLVGRPEDERYLTFKIDKSLAFLPVELLYDGTNFVAMEIAMGRLVYTEDTDICPPADSGRQRSVVIVGDPSEDPAIRADVEAEIDTLRRVFSPIREFSLRISIGSEVDGGYLLENLPGAAVFHLTGHGVTKEDDREAGVRLASDKVFSGHTVRGLHNPPVLVFLNICTAASRSVWLSSLGIVETLLRRGTRACVASLWDLSSKTATLMASRFYTHLLWGQTFGHALRTARSEVAVATGLHDATWAAYALYGDPELGLLSAGAERARRRQAARTVIAVCAILFALAAILFPVSLEERLGNGDQIPVGYLVATSTPAGAKILIDGKERGVTPSSIEIESGSHHVILDKQGYRRWEAWVEIKPTERTPINAHLPRLD